VVRRGPAGEGVSLSSKPEEVSPNAEFSEKIVHDVSTFFLRSNFYWGGRSTLAAAISMAKGVT